MRKLGTPIGAGPKLATVRLGFWSVGEPSELRRAGSVILARSDLATVFASLPFFFSFEKSPATGFPALALGPVVVLPCLPGLPVVVVVEPVPVVVVVVDVVVPDPVGSSDSSSSAGLEQPGSLRSTRPSLSLSVRSAHCGRTVVTPSPAPVVVDEVGPVETELAVPAAEIARAAPRAMMTRSFFLIG
jgi:hypothetical protein